MSNINRTKRIKNKNPKEPAETNQTIKEESNTEQKVLRPTTRIYSIYKYLAAENKLEREGWTYEGETIWKEKGGLRNKI